MFNPIKLNLSLGEYCPYDNKIDTLVNDLNKIGGNPYNTILSINNDLFKYLEGLYIDNTNTYTNKRNQIYFKFDDSLNKKKDVLGSSYLGRGGLTSVFAIKYIYQDKNILPEIQDKNLIIRIFDSFYSNDMDEWINKYNQQRIIFGSNLIQIYLYGQIMLKNKIIGYYIITRTYLDYTQILQLNYNQAVNYFNSFLNFIILIKTYNYYYRDLKFTNIGLDLDNINTNDDCKFIVLDYDDITLIKNTDDFFTNFEAGCSDKFCAGTLIPYFIIKDYLTLEQNWLDLFDKLYVVGMVDVIINLFFLRDANTNELLKMIYSPSKYTSCIHYYQYLSLFDSEDKNKLLNNFIDNLKPKFIEINNIKKQTLINIIKNLLSTDYFAINNPEVVKQEFKNDIVDLPSEIKTSSGNLVSLDNIEFVPWVETNSSTKNTNTNTVTSNDLRFGLKKKTKYYLINNKK